MGSLVLVDQINLSTRLGTSCIQLYLGDITALPVEDKVDIVFTSAFPSDYVATPGTLIRALKKNLDISVQSLAEKKELDLRANFSCWMSSSLPNDKPFRRLVCFEINHKGQTVVKQMSMVYRAMMPIFNNTESSIITPILASGNQGAPEDAMLRVMVDTACHWIKAGLPLKCLKIVLFSRKPEEDMKLRHRYTIHVFTGLKNKWKEKEENKDSEKKYDVSFCFAKEDSKWVDMISKQLREQDQNLEIYSNVFEASTTDSWQDEVFNVLASSKRVLIILTQSYIDNQFCLEQFSLALCCNRLQGGRGVVIPLLMETVQGLPSYLNLVQYTDCRVRREGDTFEAKVLSACVDIVKGIHDDVAIPSEPTEKEQAYKPPPTYDIFISYSHRDTELAHTAVHLLEKHHPQITAFFDRSELKTGSIWQQSLYDAVDRTHCFLAFLCDDYLESTVCQEEFYIALGRTLTKDNILLVPIFMKNLTTLPSSFCYGHPVSVTNEEQLKDLLDKIVAALEIKESENKLTMMPLKITLSSRHKVDFDSKYSVNEQNELVPKSRENCFESFGEVSGQITFSYVHDGLKFAAILSELLKMIAPNVVSTLLSAGESESRTAIDQSDMTVVFVSDDFLKSRHHVQELHMALCKQRSVKNSTVVYLVEVSHNMAKPFFPHLLPFQLGVDEQLWATLSKGSTTKKAKFIVSTEGLQGTYTCSPAHHMALRAATLDILSFLSKRGTGSTIPVNMLNVARIHKTLKGIEDFSRTPSEVAIPVSELELKKSVPEIDDNFEDDEPDEAVIAEIVQMMHGPPQRCSYSREQTASERRSRVKKMIKDRVKLKSRGKESWKDTSDAVNAEFYKSIVKSNIVESAHSKEISDSSHEIDIEVQRRFRKFRGFALPFGRLCLERTRSKQRRETAHAHDGDQDEVDFKESGEKGKSLELKLSSVNEPNLNLKDEEYSSDNTSGSNSPLGFPKTLFQLHEHVSIIAELSQSPEEVPITPPKNRKKCVPDSTMNDSEQGARHTTIDDFMPAVSDSSALKESGHKILSSAKDQRKSVARRQLAGIHYQGFMNEPVKSIEHCNDRSLGLDEKVETAHYPSENLRDQREDMSNSNKSSKTCVIS